MEKGRIAYIDIAKTICIFLMVVGHWTSNGVLIKYIYSFHMPALFIISGYLYKPRPWFKTVLSFGIPVVFFSLVNLAFLLISHEIQVRTLFTKEIFFRFFHYRYGLSDGLYMGDWFIWALLGLRLIFGDVKIFSGLKKISLVIGIFVVIYMSINDSFLHIETIYRGWYIFLLVPSLPFFCLGIFLKDKAWTPNKIPNYVFFVFILLFFAIPIYNGECSINSQQFGRSYAIFFVNSSVSSLLVFVLSSRIPSSNFCTVMSKGTLLILGIHMLLMNVLSSLLPSFCSFLIPFIVMLVCFPLIKWLDKTCPILLGKIK